jgi:pimeloyl-ACP methyl ester carboxylesterase
MSRILSLLVILTFLLGALPAQTANAQIPVEITPPWVLPNPPGNCIQTGGIPNEAFCAPLVPGPNNTDLVIFAHGYMRPAVPNGTIPADQMVLDGMDISTVVTGLGYAFATTSYRRNGLVVLDAVQDIQDLIRHLPPSFGKPSHIYLIGASEGGLITTLSVEQHPETISGGVAMCGPIGDFRQQINYWGDFRAVFDYEFRGQNILPPTAVSIPTDFYNSWWGNPAVIPTVMAQIGAPANQNNLDQLMKISKAPYDPTDPQGKLKTTLGLLDYNINATNNGVDILGGNPFDNRLKWYSGSVNDFSLNSGVIRYTASPLAISHLAPYQTSGKLTKPLITLHTTGDEIVPYWHEPLYTLKTLVKGSLWQHVNIPITRYGHCNFTAKEAVFAFAWMVFKVTGTIPLTLLGLQTDPQPVLTLEEYHQMMQQYGPKVYIPMTQK